MSLKLTQSALGAILLVALLGACSKTEVQPALTANPTAEAPVVLAPSSYSVYADPARVTDVAALEAALNTLQPGGSQTGALSPAAQGKAILDARDAFLSKITDPVAQRKAYREVMQKTLQTAESRKALAAALTAYYKENPRSAPARPFTAP